MAYVLWAIWLAAPFVIARALARCGLAFVAVGLILTVTAQIGSALLLDYISYTTTPEVERLSSTWSGSLDMRGRRLVLVWWPAGLCMLGYIAGLLTRATVSKASAEGHPAAGSR